MLKAVQRIRVEWSHCDPARIIFNPHYYIWMDQGAHGLMEAAGFPFVDPPDPRSIADGMALLEELGALVPDERGGERRLTRLGRRLALPRKDGNVQYTPHGFPEDAAVAVVAFDLGLAHVAHAAVQLHRVVHHPVAGGALGAIASSRFRHPSDDRIYLQPGASRVVLASPVALGNATQARAGAIDAAVSPENLPAWLQGLAARAEPLHEDDPPPGAGREPRTPRSEPGVDDPGQRGPPGQARRPPTKIRHADEAVRKEIDHEQHDHCR